MPGLVTFSSDYGHRDEFVGVCHAVIARIAPSVRVIDLVHGLRGVRAGAAVLAQVLRYAPDGVHLAVVDPGVGGGRRGVAIACASGSVLVGPDNGLLPPAADVLGGTERAVELVQPRFRLQPVSATFHGRDVFAPAAAHLASGVGLEEFGPAIPEAELVRIPGPRVEAGDGFIEAEVLRTDHFGNLQLAARREHLEVARLGDRVRLVAGEAEARAAVGRTFGDVGAGELLVYLDSVWHVAVTVNAGAADRRLGFPDVVRIERAD